MQNVKIIKKDHLFDPVIEWLSMCFAVENRYDPFQLRKVEESALLVEIFFFDWFIIIIIIIVIVVVVVEFVDKNSKQETLSCDNEGWERVRNYRRVTKLFLNRE